MDKRNAIITGSSNGLGLAIAKHLVNEGYNVGVSARSQDRLKDVIASLEDVNTSQAKIAGGVVDFTRSDQVKNFVEQVSEELGEIDLLINNAGIYMEDEVSSDIEQNLQKCLDVNLMSSVRMNAAIDSHLKNGASIINIVSIAAMELRHDAASYTLSKVALRSYTDMQREVYRKRGIRVIGFYPGAMNTRSWDGTGVDANKMIQPSDICKQISSIMEMSDNTGIEEVIINPVKPI